MDDSYHFNCFLDFIAWWRSGLAAWLPEVARQKLGKRSFVQCIYTKETLVFQRIAKHGEVAEQKQFAIQSLISQPSDLHAWLKPYQQQDIVLLVDDDWVLSKQLVFPAQAKDNLSTILQFEIDRQTPFVPAQVHYCYTEVAVPENGSESITVVLSVIPKQVVVPVFELLQQFSISPVGLRLKQEQGLENEIKFDEGVGNQGREGSRVNYALACLVLILSLAVLYQPVMHYGGLIDDLAPELAQAKKQAASVSALKRENVKVSEQLRFVDERLADYHYRLALLNGLSSVLPSHTWLEQSDIKKEVLTIRGESSAASDLIELLLATGWFKDVRFSAPITHNSQSGKERFQIEAVMSVGAHDEVD